MKKPCGRQVVVVVVVLVVVVVVLVAAVVVVVVVAAVVVVVVVLVLLVLDKWFTLTRGRRGLFFDGAPATGRLLTLALAPRAVPASLIVC